MADLAGKDTDWSEKSQIRGGCSMRCEYCPLSDPEDVCPEAEGAYGI
nr:MAG TPA_asm: Radical SAM superfamily [Caudoviricetes sp.]